MGVPPFDFSRYGGLLALVGKAVGARPDGAAGGEKSAPLCRLFRVFTGGKTVIGPKRKMHLVLWVVLLPVIVAVLVAAIQARRPMPVMDTVPGLEGSP